jgi:hypothetical protein
MCLSIRPRQKVLLQPTFTDKHNHMAAPLAMHELDKPGLKGVGKQQCHSERPQALYGHHQPSKKINAY